MGGADRGLCLRVLGRPLAPRGAAAGVDRRSRHRRTGQDHRGPPSVEDRAAVEAERPIKPACPPQDRCKTTSNMEIPRRCCRRWSTRRRRRRLGRFIGRRACAGRWLRGKRPTATRWCASRCAPAHGAGATRARGAGPGAPRRRLHRRRRAAAGLEPGLTLNDEVFAARAPVDAVAQAALLQRPCACESDWGLPYRPECKPSTSGTHAHQAPRLHHAPRAVQAPTRGQRLLHRHRPRQRLVPSTTSKRPWSAR